MTSLRFVERLRDLVGDVDVVLSDIWGVVHNGIGEPPPRRCGERAHLPSPLLGEAQREKCPLDR